MSARTHWTQVRPGVFAARRLALGLTQAELAARLGVSLRTISRLDASGDAALAPLWLFALDGLACDLWSASIRRIGELAMLGTIRRAASTPTIKPQDSSLRHLDRE